MTGRAEIGTGVLVGTLAAGPVFTMVLALGTLDEGYRGPVDQLLTAAAIGLTIAVPIGAILAVIPVLLGATILGWLGGFNEGSRLPPFWGLVGGAAAAAPAWWFGDSNAAWVFGATGAICALAARWRVRWTEGELAPRYGRA